MILQISCSDKKEEKIKEERIAALEKRLAVIKEKLAVPEAVPEAKKQPEIKEYYITLNATKINSQKIKINVETNFPEGTNLMFDVYRTYYQKGKTDAYTGEIYNNEFPVINKKIELVVDVSDTEWFNVYKQKFEQYKEGAFDIFTGIEKISPKIKINVLFTPKGSQPDKVLEILGNEGEFINGSGIDKSMGFNTFSVSKSINIPFKR
jgi:hypothetical protein